MDDPRELERLRNYKPSVDDLKMRPPEPLHGNAGLGGRNPNEGYTNDNVAKYVTIAVLGSMIHSGKKITEVGFMEFYAAVLDDLNRGSMERSLIEFDNVINRIKQNNSTK
jgi:hypothetical protein